MAALIALAALIAVAPVAAQPSISSTSGTWSHKGSVTISGSGFGSKGTGAPVIWDDASGTDVNTQWSGAWPNCSGNSSNNLNYRTPAQVGRSVGLPHSRITKYIAGAHNGTGGAVCGANVILWKTRTVSGPSYSYWSYYQRVDNGWRFGDDDNFKTFAYSEGAGPYNMPNNWYIEYNPRPTSNSSGAVWHLNDDAYGTSFQSLKSPDNSGHSWWWNDAVNPMSGSWIKVEIELKYTSQTDGYIKLWENGVLKIDYKGPTDKLPGSSRTEGIGGYARNYPYASNWRYFADVYLDYSRARVILGNASTYSASTLREVQVPTSWSASSITVSANLGAFANGATAYVYVVDPNGVVNSTGRAITIGSGGGGGGGDTTSPTTSLTSPANGATVSSTLSVSASASDNVGVAGVQFKLDGANLGAEDTSAPYSVSWNTTTVANGSHVLTAVARDAAGNQATAASRTVTVSNSTPDTQSPTSSITSPASGATVSATVTVSASASDNVGVTGVQFKLDGANLGAEDMSAPYSVSWNTTTVANGSHVLTAVARDAAGNQATAASRTVTVSNSTPDTQSPTSSITSPASGATVSATVTVSASASDNVGVVGVQFKLDGANLGAEDMSAPYSVSWNTTGATNGSHVLSAVARDAAGNQATAAARTVTVSNSTPDTQSPTSSITSPANGASVSATITLAASASDNVGVTGVQFKLDGANLGAEDTTAPYSVSWNTTSAGNGSHVVTAVARDAAGNQSTSSGVTVTVSNSTPPPATGLISAYGMDAGSGSTVADMAGSNTGTIAGATWSTQGRFGAALSFDGVNDLVNIPDAASLDLSSAMTIEAWVKPTTLTGWRSVMMKESSGGLAYVLYANDNDPKPAAYVRIAGQSASGGTSGPSEVPLNTWTHLAATYDGTTFRMYVDGVLVDSQPLSGSIIQTTNPLRIGGNAVWGEYFAGLIDEVRIYNRALSAAEIQADMTTPVGNGSSSIPPLPPTGVHIVP